MSKQVREELKNTGSARLLVVLDEKAADGGERFRRCFQPTAHQRQGRAASVSGAGAAVAADSMLYLPNLGVVYGNVNAAGWKQLQQELKGADAVAGVQTLRPIRSTPAKTALPKGELSWGLQRINAPKLWQQGLTGKGVLIAHLDTGVDGAHPALKGAIREFAAFDETGVKMPTATPTDSDMHGTHTGAIIAGRPTADRVVGVAPGCQLVSGMVMEGGDLVARVLAGVEWALRHPVKVLNLSLGFPGYFEEYVPLLSRIRRKGILPVFAVGNDGPGASRSPGNYANCLSVGACDANDRIYPESSSQRFRRKSNPLVPDLVMPGVDVISANAGGADYRMMSGTSMAAPHCTGLAALLWEAVPEASVDQIEQAIFASARRPASLEKDRANRGVPDAVRALKGLQELVSEAGA
jgi:subtilisin family serine protease